MITLAADAPRLPEPVWGAHIVRIQAGELSVLKLGADRRQMRTVWQVVTRGKPRLFLTPLWPAGNDCFPPCFRSP